jgi:hypothetical protein
MMSAIPKAGMGDVVCQSNGNKDTFPKAVDWVDLSNAAIDCSPVSILADM